MKIRQATKIIRRFQKSARYRSRTLCTAGAACLRRQRRLHGPGGFTHEAARRYHCIALTDDGHVEPIYLTRIFLDILDMAGGPPLRFETERRLHRADGTEIYSMGDGHYLVPGAPPIRLSQIGPVA